MKIETEDDESEKLLIRCSRKVLVSIVFLLISIGGLINTVLMRLFG